MTLREYMWASRAMATRQEQDLQRLRVLQQEQAHLMAAAFHKPNDIPDLTKPRRAPGDQADMTPQQSAALLGAFFRGVKPSKEI